MGYRLICASDSHGRRPPETDHAPVTAWLHAGDAYDGPSILTDDEQPLPGDPIAEPMRCWLRSRSERVYGVHGNHDVSDPYRWFDRVEAVDGRVTRLRPKLVVVGIGWHGEKYFELPRESDLRRVCDDARRQVLRLTMPSDCLVLLTHYPPRLPGVFPKKPGAIADAGSDTIADFARELRPVLIVQGHEHFWFGRSEYVDFGGRQSLVVNPGSAGMSVVVDADTDSAAVE